MIVRNDYLSIFIIIWGPVALLLLPESTLIYALLVPLIIAGCWLLWLQRQLTGLNRWLQEPNKNNKPKPYGVWHSIIEQIETIHDKNRNRKRKLRRMLNGFRESSNALPDATVILNSNGKMEWCNATARNMLGLHPIRDHGTDIQLRLGIESLTRYMEQHDFTQPLQLRSPIDPELYIEVRIVPYGKGKLLLQARDITRLIQLETVRRDFVANVSHEMRTPLTVIHGYLETLSDSRNEDGGLIHWATAIDAMQQQSHRLIGIVEDLLLLSRVESIDSFQGSDQIDIKSLMETLVCDAERLSNGRGHTISMRMDEELPLSGSHSEIVSAFSNLVFNAVRYTPNGGDISICWQTESGYPCFSVEDNGIGIASEHLSRLTERFYRVDVGRSRESGGTGLGLAIVNHVLARHNARLHIDSQVGHGSKFSCYFPRQAKVEQQMAS